MARLKDEQKRKAILETSKMLFSQKGFFNASISDIVHETGFPVGTIYTYFRNKEEIIQVIVDEGWKEFRNSLEQAISTQTTPAERLGLVIDEFLPALLEDVDFINILLSEAIQYTHIERKIEELTTIISSLIPSVASSGRDDAGLSRHELEIALVVYFLGILNAARISRNAAVGMTVEDLIEFVRSTVSQSVRFEFPRKLR